MKSTCRILEWCLLICLFHAGSKNTVYGQTHVIITAGVGFPEFLNAGARLQIHYTQVGISIGYVPPASENSFSLAFDFYQHFGKISSLSKIPGWYGRIGLIDVSAPYIVSKDMYYLTTRLGHDINISHNVGIDIDIGAIFLLNYQSLEPEGLPPVSPAIGLCLFYRI